MTKLLIHYGELVSEPGMRRRGLLMVAAAACWLMFFLIIPSVMLVALAFLERGADGQVIVSFTLENFRRLLGFGIEGWSGDYLRILARSSWVAFVTTLLSILFAYPLAFFIASRPARSRYVWLALVVIPLCTNLVIRTYGWMLILSSRMPPAALAQWLGFIPPETSLYPGPFAVYLGMLSNSLPFAALPLYTSVERMNWSLVEAAQDLYASRVRVFMHGVLPQTLPGLVTAIILTFIPALGIFVIPDLLGGSKYMLVGNLIQQQFGSSRDWPFGAAISFGLMALTLAGLFIIGKWGEGSRAEADLG